MKTLDKYVAREMIVPFVSGFTIVLVLLVGTIIYNNISFIVDKMNYWPDLLYWVFLQIPYWVMVALPSGALFGCSLAITRLAQDTEITMMRMAGIRTTRIFLPIFAIGCLVSIMAYVFQEKVTVWAQDESAKVQRRLFMAPGPLTIQPNIFFKIDNYCVYVSSIERHGNVIQLNNIMMYEMPYGDGLPTLITAKSATEHKLIWTLNDCTMWQVKNREPELYAHFKTHKMNMQRAMAEFIDQQQKTPGAMTISELYKQMKLMKKSGLPSRNYEVEYNFKLAIPLCSLILMFCVAPLSLKYGRSGGFMGVLIGILVLFFYWNVFVFSRALAEKGALQPLLAGWSEVIIFTALGALLMWKVE